MVWLRAFFDDLLFLLQYSNKTGIGATRRLPQSHKRKDALRLLYGTPAQKNRSSMTLDEAHRELGKGAYAYKYAPRRKRK